MDRPWSSQLKKGAVELMVLAALQGGEAYGYQLLQRLADTSVLGTTESTLYPVLSRLCEEGLVTVRQAPSPAGPPRRYYRLTPAGREHLEQLAAYWREFSQAIDLLLGNTALERRQP